MSAPTVPSPEAQPFLTFQVASQEFGCGLLRVREILQVAPISPVPSTPACIRGVMNVRGSVIPVVDLSVKLGRGEAQFSQFTCVIILEMEIDGEQTPIGVLSDKVNDVIELAPGEIEAPPPFGMGVRIEFLEGLGKVGQRFVPLLDMDRVLSTAELLAAAEIESAAEAAAAALPQDTGGIST
ncbi:MAG TPA: chemotaxis protein CheW [Kofleriaceae bacterium]|nr:chemotaxis protein CheW [Kofleriaceae bacterium]